MRKSCLKRKVNIFIPLKVLVGLILYLTSITSALSDSDIDIFSLSLEELVNVKVSSTSRVPQTISTTTSSITVFTKDQIRAMGAKNLYDVLRHAPGMQVGLTNRGRTTIGMRGLSRDTSNYIQFQLNGHTLNEPHNGSATFLLDTANLPLQNIKQVEVVRGPASSLYGTHAFLGVINIITEDIDDFSGAQVNYRDEFEDTGSIARQLNFKFAKKFGEGHGLTFNLNAMEEGGVSQFIEQDFFGHSGNADNDLEQYDLQARYQSEHFEINTRLRHQKREEFAGPISVLSPDSETKSDYAFIDAQWRHDAVLSHAIKIRAYYDYGYGEAELINIPPGSAPPGLLAFLFNSNGNIGHISLNATKIGLETQATYAGFAQHVLTYGAAFERQEQDDLKVITNWDGSFSHPSTPYLVDRSDTENFGEDARRDINSLFIEDIWQISDNVIVNLGMRYDNFSDFGDTLNPKASLRWDIAPEFALRLLYGTAFRAPDFRDLYLSNTPPPAPLGNSSLQAEEIETFEIGFNSRLAKRVQLNTTIFRNQISDMIAQPPDQLQLQNMTDVETNGVELELRYDFEQGGYLLGNYSYIKSTLDDGSDYPGVPNQNGSLLLSLPVSNKLSLGGSVLWASESPRSENDTRDEMSGFTSVNLNAHYKPVKNDFSIEIGIRNLFDEEYESPDTTGSIAGDFPEPGRTFFFGLEYRLK
ncbi:MAG: TonB-dependent receptor [Proteobacteria bacterium]|nr:TonB-dependent receptor [Pseudomonadota bacterium]